MPLRALGQLEELDVSLNELSGHAIEAISGIAQLRKLMMRVCYLGLSGVNLRPLGALQRLEELDVRGNLLNREELTEILPHVAIRVYNRD